MYYVYMLQSPKADDVYIGFTPDLRRRMREHRSEHRNWRLIYYEAYASRERCSPARAKAKASRLRQSRTKETSYKQLMSVSQIGAGRSERGQPTV